MPDQTPGLPPHIEDTLNATAQIDAEHYGQARVLQRVVNGVTAWAGHPGFVVVLTLFVVAWILGNLMVGWSGRVAWDPPPFNWLGGVASLVALYVTLFILAAQRHDDELATHRGQITLNLAILSEQKVTKVIHLLEELRRDSPHLDDRVDDEAQALSARADLQSVLDAVKEGQETSGRPKRN